MRYRRTDMAGAKSLPRHPWRATLGSIPSPTYFFTVNLAERDRTLLTDHVVTLRAVIHGVKQRHPFHIDAMVILSDHLHCVLTLPEGDADYPLRWSLIKAGFSRRIAKTERRIFSLSLRERAGVRAKQRKKRPSSCPSPAGRRDSGYVAALLGAHDPR